MSGLTHVAAWTSPIVNSTEAVLSDPKVFRVYRNPKPNRVTSKLLRRKEVTMWHLPLKSPHLRGIAGSTVASVACAIRHECWTRMSTATRLGVSWFAPSKTASTATAGTN
jgi:hypothetical protein